jgi:uncharacterized integral membrane protein
MTRFLSPARSAADRDNRGIDGEARPVAPTRTRGLWIALAVSAAMLLLLIFILQNDQPSDVHFMGAQGQLPMGVALLLAAVAGALLVTLPILLRAGLRRGARRQGSTDNLALVEVPNDVQSVS